MSYYGETKMIEIKVGQTIAWRKKGYGCYRVVMMVASVERVSADITYVRGTGIRLTGLPFLAHFYVLIDSTVDTVKIVSE